MTKTGRTDPCLVVLAFIMLIAYAVAGSTAAITTPPPGLTAGVNGSIVVPFINLTPKSAAPPATVAGDIWYNSQTGAPSWQTASGSIPFAIPIPTSADSTTLSNPTAATVFSSVATIPANALAAAPRLVDVVAFGKYTTGTTITPTLQLGINVDGTDVATSGLVSTAISLTDKSWYLSGSLIIRTSGASGTLTGFARGELGGLLAAAVPVSQVGRSGSTAIDTTVSHVVKPSAKFGVSDASNAITCEGLVVTVR